MKKANLILKIMEGVAFALSGLCLYYAFPDIVELLFSTTPDPVSMIPYFLMTILLLTIFFTSHALLHNASKTSRKVTLCLGGGLLLTLGAANTIYLMVLAFQGGFANLWESRFNLLYPVDSLIVSLLSDFLGAALILYGWKKADAVEFVCPSKKAMWKRILGDYLFGPLFLMISMFFLGAFLHLPWTIDRDPKNLGVTLPFYFLMVLPVVEVGLYEYLARENKDEKKTYSYMMIGVTSFLGAGIVFSIWGYFASINNPYALTESMTAYFPIDSMGSMNLGPVLLTFINLLPGLIYLLNYLFAKKKELTKKENA